MVTVDAFIDESSRETPEGFCYVIAAAVTVDDSDLVRDAMLKLRASNQPALHWHSEKAARRREIVHRVAELDVQAFGVCCHPVPAKRQERARGPDCWSG